MEFWADLWRYVGLSAPEAIAIVFSTAVLYSLFALMIRLWGQRFYADRSSTGLAVVLVLGAITGRAMLGHSPTLGGGLLALGTLIIMEQFLGLRVHLRRLGRPRRAIVVMARGQIRSQVLRHYHLADAAVWSRLREAGVHSANEVFAVILEPSGVMSVIRKGSPVDAALLRGVRGADTLMPRSNDD